MITYKKEKETSEFVIYDYFPENGDDKGTVKFYKKTQKFESLVIPEIEKKYDFWYRDFIIKKLREFDDSSYENEGIIIWY